jgi:hypothetical protein
MQWHIAGRPSDMSKMPLGRAKVRARKQEYQKVSIQAKVKHHPLNNVAVLIGQLHRRTEVVALVVVSSSMCI